MVITLIPTLAAYDTQTFSEHFLHKAMAHLLTQLTERSERSFGTLQMD
jgi:FKBP12-rapamycin complex-associated protein